MVSEPTAPSSPVHPIVHSFRCPVPAWQRLQAVRAIEFYRNEVLATAEPDLLEIRQILSRTADGERHSVHVVTPDAEADLIGVVNTSEPRWIQKMRAELRLMHYALSDHEKNFGGR